MQYYCTACNEPVSDELSEPILESGVVIVCLQCILDKVYKAPIVMINIPGSAEAAKTYDEMMADEMAAQYNYIVQTS
jgi:hypothetical protein